MPIVVEFLKLVAAGIAGALAASVFGAFFNFRRFRKEKYGNGVGTRITRLSFRLNESVKTHRYLRLLLNERNDGARELE